MYKYNWTSNNLRERLDYLKKLRETEQDPKLLELIDVDIEDLYEEILEIEEPEKEDTPNLIENYTYFREKFLNARFLWPEIKLFNETTKNNFLDIPPLKGASFSKDDLLDLTHDFYKSSLDKFWFHNFLKHYRDRYTHIKFESSSIYDKHVGEAIHILGLEEAFITVEREHTTSDVFTTIHEYSRATCASINPRHLLGANYTFCETYPMFMELVAADYLIKVLKNDEPMKVKATDYESYYYTANVLNSKIGLIEAEESFYKDGYPDNKTLKESASKYCKLSSDYVDELIQYGSDSYNYVISYLIAIELFMQYKEDKEKALYNLKRILLLDCKSELEYFNNVKKLGVIINGSTREFNRDMSNIVLELAKRND